MCVFFLQAVSDVLSLCDKAKGEAFEGSFLCAALFAVSRTM